MFRLLIRLFIKDKDNTGDPAVRRSYATLASIYGICINVILFGAKYFAGVISASVAVTADAFNNLSDAASSVITLIGFRLSGKRADPKHPFGHGRIEYLAGFIVSAIIIVVGGELGISSIKKIIHPEPIEAGLVPAVIMGAAILVKFYMFTYNRYAGKRISSEALKATASDSLTDCIATAVTLISMGLAYFFNINIDGWAGILVSIFILYAGITSAIDTVSPLLGQAPDPELVKGIEKTVMEYPDIIGIHDMIVHDYGPGRVYVSLHAEVDGKGDIFELHDAIDNAEHEISERFNCLATIHMDPIDADNEMLTGKKDDILNAVRSIYPEATIHDLRMVPGPTHTNLVFDVVLPADCKDNDDEANKKITEKVDSLWEDCFSVIQIDRSYV